MEPEKLQENMEQETPKISAGTIARTVIGAIALINTVLVMMGKTPLDLDENMVYTVCSGAATIVTTVVAWWYNNSFSKAARIGDAAMKSAKSQGSDV